MKSYKKEITALVLFGVAASVGYYFWYKNKKQVKF
jgi:hypothetical protein